LNELSNLEKASHVLVFLAEAVLVVFVFWACDATLRPEAVVVQNDTQRSVTLRNCQYSLGATSSVLLDPGESKSVYAVNACEVHAPAYIGCLLFPQDVFARGETARVSRTTSHVTATVCGETDAKEVPSDASPGRN
jgi:hypothetical protein